MKSCESIPLAVEAAEFARLIEPLGPFEPAPLIAIAVSGGVDSMALVILASAWAAALGGRAVALTVDHGLRPASRAEAEQVGRWLSARNIKHHILTWAGSKPRSGVQAAARNARYRLLSEECRQRGILHLLTAHQADDQAETVLLRVARGSGIDGLAGMPVRRGLNGVMLLRPLLSISRARLEATCVAAGQGWLEDPSNLSPRFARPRLRNATSALAAEGLTREGLNRIARRADRARQALDHASAVALAESCALYPEGYCFLDLAQLAEQPEEIRLRALARCVATIGGNAYPPRLESLEGLAQQLSGRVFAGARTLGGCIFSTHRGRLLIRREERAIAPPEPLPPSVLIRWDNRFLAHSAHNDTLTVGRLGRAASVEFARKRPHLGPRVVPRAVIPTLPAVFDQQGLVAVPHLDYVQAAFRGKVVIRFAPGRSLSGRD